jgi:hypothetical protein
LTEDEQTSKHGGGGRYNVICNFIVQGEQIKNDEKEKEKMRKKKKKKMRKRKRKRNNSNNNNNVSMSKNKMSSPVL